MTLLKKALLLFGVVFYACSPGVGPEKIKDPRTYSWSADTLFHENASATDMENAWGSSPDDVYLSGHSSISKPLYHFDGAACPTECIFIGLAPWGKKATNALTPSNACC